MDCNLKELVWTVEVKVQVLIELVLRPVLEVYNL